MRINLVPWPRLNRIARASQACWVSPLFGFSACPLVSIRLTSANPGAQRPRAQVIVKSYNSYGYSSSGSSSSYSTGSNGNSSSNNTGGGYYSSSGAPPAASSYAKHLTQPVNFEGVVKQVIFASDTTSYRYVR